MGHTWLESRKLIGLYVGKWLKLSGPLGDSYRIDRTPLIAFEHGTFQLGSGARVFMRFDKEWFDRLAILRRGAPITVLGQIRDVDGFGIQLENCKLMD